MKKRIGKNYLFLFVLVVIHGCSTAPVKLVPKQSYVQGKEVDFLSRITKLEYGYVISALSFNQENFAECGIKLPTRLNTWADEKIFINVAKILNSGGIGAIRGIKGYPTIHLSADVIKNNNGKMYSNS